MQSPHENFLVSPNRKELESMVSKPAFDAACEAATLAYLAELPQGGDNPNGDWSNYCKLQGAKRVLEILRTLHLKPEQPKAVEWRNLPPPQ